MSDLVNTLRALYGGVDAQEAMPFGAANTPQGTQTGLGAVLKGVMDVPVNLIDAAKNAPVGMQPQDMSPEQKSAYDKAILASGRTAVDLAGIGTPMAASGAAGIFGGKLAKTADLRALQEAQQMQAGGKHADDIWHDTGWMQSPMDSKWKFEIPDNKMALKYMPSSQGDKATATVDNFVSHPDLKKAYPQLFDHTMEVTRDFTKPQGTGFFDPQHPVIRDIVKPKIEITAPSMQEARSVAAHELGHGVQQLEDFTYGSSQNQFARILEEDLRRKAGVKSYDHNEMDRRTYDMYHRTAGEVEPRNIQTRLDYSPAQRRLLAPWHTQDVPYEQQLLIEALKDYK